MRRITPRLMTAAAVAAIGLGAIATGTASAAPAGALAARSTQVQFHNGTGCTLTRADYGLAHGIWSQEPPAVVYNTGDVSWQSESNGFMTGTEGSITFTTSNCEEGWRNGRAIRFHWDNPFAGSNGYDTNGTDGAFRNVIQGGGGDNALVLWGEYKN
ncbi:hypothetical protein FHS39_002257 [Streptomyces olivoverticillatus]|uniref:Crystal protein ET79 n=1 Tax=Streptomyces olivoverticillatus TaxID=66427 RepID=A0A7W7PJI4_9ACTN|nr:aegerolysin family protein [Streptomyces olivoverticillatus]MBB4893226.1 hypothetical protein [Streptomyces olivoverticillatus]